MPNRFKLSWLQIFKGYLIDFYLSDPELRKTALKGNQIHMGQIKLRAQADMKYPIFNKTNAILFRLILSTFNNTEVVSYFLRHLSKDIRKEEWPNLLNEIIFRRCFEHEFNSEGTLKINKIYNVHEGAQMFAEMYKTVQEFVSALFHEEGWVDYHCLIYVETEIKNPKTYIVEMGYFEFASKYIDIENFYSVVPLPIDFSYYHTRKTYPILVDNNTIITTTVS